MLEFIELPKWIDRSEFFKAFLEIDKADELYTFFGCNNSTAFSMFMKKYIKDKPDRVHYIAHVRELIRDEEEFNKELGIEPRVQQAVAKQQHKAFLSATGGEPEEVKSITFGSQGDKPIVVSQPRIRTAEDIWISQQLFKEAGSLTRNAWLKSHPDPKLETEDTPYADEDIFTRTS